MSHDTHSAESAENKSIVSFKNSFWLVIILVFLFVAALNFVQAESHGEEGKTEGKEKTEMTGRKESSTDNKESKAEPSKADQPKPAAEGAAGK